MENEKVDQEERKEALADLTIACTECSRLASRVEELEKALENLCDEINARESMSGLVGLAVWNAKRDAELLLAGAHAEEKE